MERKVLNYVKGKEKGNACAAFACQSRWDFFSITSSSSSSFYSRRLLSGNSFATKR